MHRRLSFLLSLVFLLVLGLGLAHSVQAATPASGLQFIGQIPIPNWTTTGANQASTDMWSLNPATGDIYITDRVNRGISVINTNSLRYLGTIPVPTCAGAPGTAPGSCPSGVVVAPDLQKLVVTDRNNPAGDLGDIIIYDLRVPNPASSPVVLTTGTSPCTNCPGGVSTFAPDTDELDYDPINQRVYVANSGTNATGAGPYFLTVVDLRTDTIFDQIPLGSNLEQPRFNSVDGFIYQTMPDDVTTATGGTNDRVVRIDPTKIGGAANVARISPPAGCAVRGIDIDPVTNTAAVACAGTTGPGVFTLSLNDGMSILNSGLGGVGGIDGEYFNPNNRRWYVGASNNRVALAATLPGTATVCPSSNGTPTIPAVGVYGITGSGPATLVGADCSGVNAHGIGVDPIHNAVFAAARQFPADPASLTTGHAGVLVWHDPAPLSQGFVQQTVVNISPVGGSTATGTILFQDNRVFASLSGLGSVVAGDFIRLVVPGTLGHEFVECLAGASGTAQCIGLNRGYPLFGGTVLLGVKGTVVGSGVIPTGTVQ